MRTSFFVSAVKRCKFPRAAMLVACVAFNVTSVFASTEPSRDFISFTSGGGFEVVEGGGVTARFFHRSDVATDFHGNTYRADAGSHAIYKTRPDGITTTLAGKPGISGSADGVGMRARFNYPNGLAVDTSGNVYVADTGNETIRKITPQGVVTTLAGFAGKSGSDDGVGHSARFNRPYSLTITPAGLLYVADTLNNTIRKINPAGDVTTIAGSPGTMGNNDGLGASATFNTPCSIAADVLGNIYVADNGHNAIRKITPAGLVNTLNAADQPVRTRVHSAACGCFCCSGGDDSAEQGCACQRSVQEAALHLDN